MLFSLQQCPVCQIIYMFMWESIRNERLKKPTNPGYKQPSNPDSSFTYKFMIWKRFPCKHGKKLTLK